MKHPSNSATNGADSVLSYASLIPVPLVRDDTHRWGRVPPMVEDQLAEVALAEREEELRIGSRALNKRVKSLEAQVVDLKARIGGADAKPLLLLDEIEELQEDIYAARWGLYELAAGTLGWEYNAADIALWCERAVAMGAYHPRLDTSILLDLVHVRQVPNAPFRECYERQLGRTTDPARKARVTLNVHRALSRIEHARGASYGSASLVEGDKPQSRILERWLGVQPNPGGGDPLPTVRLFVKYEQAEALAVAFDLSPHSSGI